MDALDYSGLDQIVHRPVRFRSLVPRLAGRAAGAWPAVRVVKFSEGSPAFALVLGVLALAVHDPVDFTDCNSLGHLDPEVLGKLRSGVPSEILRRVATVQSEKGSQHGGVDVGELPRPNVRERGA